MPDLNHFIGIPFAWNGHTHTGASCWGLIVLMYRELFGIDLPMHDSPKRIIASKADPYSETPGFNQISDGLRFGDVLQLRGISNKGTHNLHCGFALGGKDVIHSHKSSGSVVMRLDDLRFHDRFLKAFRHEDVNNG